MSLTREYLQSLDIEEEKIDSIISAYSEAEAEFSRKIEAQQAEFAEKELTATKRTKLCENLKIMGYSDASARLIANRSDFAERLEIAENGTPTNLNEVVSAIQADADFGGFTPKIENFTHTPSAPPANSGGWTKEKILAVKNTAERQRLIAENPKIFGI